MTTKAQLMSWCSNNGYVPAGEWHIPHPDFSLSTWLLIAASVYFVCRVGLTTVWSDLKSVYTYVRNYFSGTKTSTSSTTPVA